MMITQPKEQYISPLCEMLEVPYEGVICASGKGEDLEGWK